MKKQTNEVQVIEHENGLAKSTPENLLALAIEKGAGIEQLEKLMDLQERWQKQQARKSFLVAISEFQGKCPVIAKSQKVAFANTKYSFAPLGDIAEQIKELIAECNLSYRWEIADKEKEITVTCIVSHADGHSEQTTMSGAKDASGSKNDIQQRGSTITYLKRYTLTGALGISSAESDIDGIGGAAAQKHEPIVEEKEKQFLIPANKKPWDLTVKKLASEQVTIQTVEEHFRLTKEHKEQLLAEAINLQLKRNEPVSDSK